MNVFFFVVSGELRTWMLQKGGKNRGGYHSLVTLKVNEKKFKF